MAPKVSGGAISDRAKNFRWNLEAFEECVRIEPNYYIALETLKDKIVAFSTSDEAKVLSKSDLLLEIFSQIYHWIEASVFLPELFFNQQPLNNTIYETMLFSTLCSFFHTSRRIKGISLSKFVLDHHPLNFNDKESPNYYCLNLRNSEANRLRTHRNRLFSTRKVYIEKIQWNAMPKDLEYEWDFFYTLDLSEDVNATFKRIKNLNADIYKALRTTKDSGYTERLKNAYKKYMSKLSKIKYENYLELQKVILTRLCKNEEYYGLNIYRLEKEMKPYITIHEVKKVSICQSVDEESDILIKSIILKDICFPKVYESLAELPLHDLEICAKNFWGLLQATNVSSCLILDEVVEKGILGNDWEAFFRTTINKMAESIFYKPCELEFTITTESQENFMDFISAPVNFLVYRETGVVPHP